MALAFVFGTAMGLVAGYFGGWPDRILGRLTDTIMAFPLFVLAMGLYPAPFGAVLHESVNEILRLAAPGRKLLIGL